MTVTKEIIPDKARTAEDLGDLSNSSTPGQATPDSTASDASATTTIVPVAEPKKEVKGHSSHEDHLRCCCCCPKRKDGHSSSSDDSDKDKKDGEKDEKKEDEKKDDEKDKEESEESVEEGKLLELKHLDWRPDADGNMEYREPKDPKPKQDTSKWKKWALCEVRNFTYDDEYGNTRLEINSEPLKRVLKRVIGDDYPGVSFTTQMIDIPHPLDVFYHYLDDLKKELETSEEAEEKEHLAFLLKYVEEEMGADIRDAKNLIEGGFITYELLWTIFKPSRIATVELQQQQRAFRISEYSYTYGRCPGFSIQFNYIDFNGNDFGLSTGSVRIPQFLGTRKITDLPTVPMDYNPDAAALRAKLIARGRKFESLRGKQYCHYSAMALGRQLDNGKHIIVAVNGPVMVDYKMFEQINPERMIEFSHSDIEVSLDEDEPDLSVWEHPDRKQYLTDDQALLATAVVHGFAFNEKKWLAFYVDQLVPPHWNDKAFDQLVLPAKHKRLVRALVESHAKDTAMFDDIVQGKGKGLVAVLHGPPGVGKTLTAEAVSHVIHRPLYMVTSGELGTYSSSLEENLSRILNVASAWRCCLLIDEADVFLEKREAAQIDRNALVSVFLRLLEYYQGILFLTTNRLKTFDEAFQSRIHVALKYNPLDERSRRQIWRNFLSKVKEVRVDEKALDVLAGYTLNGREIKNAIRTAGALAEVGDGDGTWGLEELETVLKLQRDFEVEMRGERAESMAIYN